MPSDTHAPPARAMLRIDAKERLIFALDVPSRDHARALVQSLAGVISFYKVGLQLYMAAGPEFVDELVGAELGNT